VRYLGGKSRAQRYLVEAISPFSGMCDRYVEPFLGGGAAAEVLVPLFPPGAVLADGWAEIIDFWHGITYEGWFPPRRFSRSAFRATVDGPPGRLRAFALTATSFGASSKSTYAFDPGTPWRQVESRYAESARRRALAQAAVFRRHQARIVHADFGDHDVGPGTLVYCDPPYRGVTGYETFGMPPFDFDRFDATVAAWAAAGATVLVSEERPAPGWVEIASWPQARTLARANGTIVMERLFYVSPG